MLTRGPTGRGVRVQVGDLVLLEKIDEDSILQTLKRRHAQDLIYTVSCYLLARFPNAEQPRLAGARAHRHSLVRCGHVQYIGEVLISVNPFKEIRGLYDDAAITAYRGRYMYELPPHVYALSEDTYRALLSDREVSCALRSASAMPAVAPPRTGCLLTVSVCAPARFAGPMRHHFGRVRRRQD